MGSHMRTLLPSPFIMHPFPISAFPSAFFRLSFPFHPAPLHPFSSIFFPSLPSELGLLHLPYYILYPFLPFPHLFPLSSYNQLPV